MYRQPCNSSRAIGVMRVMRVVGLIGFLRFSHPEPLQGELGNLEIEAKRDLLLGSSREE